MWGSFSARIPMSRGISIVPVILKVPPIPVGAVHVSKRLGVGNFVLNSCNDKVSDGTCAVIPWHERINDKRKKYFMIRKIGSILQMIIRRFFRDRYIVRMRFS